MPILPMSAIPADLSGIVRDVGQGWAVSALRPRLSSDVKARWDLLINHWVDSDLPLVVRRSGGVRGAVVMHSSRRRVVLADNSPAQWAFSRAFAGYAYSVHEIREFLRVDEVPFAYAVKKADRGQMEFHCTLSARDNVNKTGWKLCHIEDVGLRTRARTEDLPIESVEQHFRLLIAPSNHFLVPLAWSGIGELPEVIDEIRRVETARFSPLALTNAASS